jgi:death-on-curing protein
MNEPKWIRIEAVLSFHICEITRRGGVLGVRDRSLLDSALARPRNLFAYGSPDLAALAASYAFGLVRNHPFVDGNKRAAWATCRAFLLINGYAVNSSEFEKADQVLKLAASETSEDEFAEWIRSRLTPRA